MCDRLRLEVGCHQAVAWLLSFFSAYRIHVSRSTVQALLSLDEGYKIDVRGQTELKVRDCPRDRILGSRRSQLASVCELGIEVILCGSQFRSKKSFFLGAIWFFSRVRGMAEKLWPLTVHLCSALVPSTHNTYNSQSSYEKDKMPPRYIGE